MTGSGSVIWLPLADSCTRSMGARSLRPPVRSIRYVRLGGEAAASWALPLIIPTHSHTLQLWVHVGAFQSPGCAQPASASRVTARGEEAAHAGGSNMWAPCRRVCRNRSRRLASARSAALYRPRRRCWRTARTPARPPRRPRRHSFPQACMMLLGRGTGRPGRSAACGT